MATEQTMQSFPTNTDWDFLHTKKQNKASQATFDKEWVNHSPVILLYKLYIN